MLCVVDILNDLEEILSRDTLVQRARIINDSYTTFMSDMQIWEMVVAALGPTVEHYMPAVVDNIHGHRFVSELLLKYYPAERVIKYHFVKEHLAHAEEVTVFEFYVDRSRLDVARVNGQSFAYELKTEYDRLDKLTKQINDYAKVFEYVVSVVHSRHLSRVLECVPSYVGVQTYSHLDGDPVFETVREPELSPVLSAGAQVRNLSSKDLASVLKAAGQRVPATKEERAQLVLQELDSSSINLHFKLALKDRFRLRWLHVQQHFEQIEPVDVQAFYKSQAEPDWIYYRPSSIL